jgi:hypothetical protein
MKIKVKIGVMNELFSYPFRANGDGTHIACVTYGTRAQEEFTFNDGSVRTKEKALKRIDKIYYRGGLEYSCTTTFI